MEETAQAPPTSPPAPKDTNSVSRMTRFLWWCSGAVFEKLKLYPTEKSKYEGIGGAVLTTGVLAFVSGFYAVYSTIASGAYGVWVSIAFGLLWSLAIFNLDRYIVASLRKPTGSGIRWRQRLSETWLPVVPRIALAIVIGISLSKPLELRLFQSAIASQAEINRDRLVRVKRTALEESSRIADIRSEFGRLNDEVRTSEARAESLDDDFRKESDGTGGSRRYGYSEVARLKEVAALEARRQAVETSQRTAERRSRLQAELDSTSAQIDRQVAEFRQGLSEDFLTRMAALGELSAGSSAIWWISAFVTFLLVGIEITPVLVKLMSPIGPYDVQIDAIHGISNHETILKRDVSMRVASHHYELTESAERQADEVFYSLRTTLAKTELERSADEWSSSREAGEANTMDQLVANVKSGIFTLRTP